MSDLIDYVGMFRTSILNTCSLRKEWEANWQDQPDHIKTSYGEEYLESGIKMTNSLVNTLASSDTRKVSDAVCHAVLSPTPRARYPVGFDANTLWMAIATLPTSFGDFVTNLLAKPIVPAARMKCLGIGEQ